MVMADSLTFTLDTIFEIPARAKIFVKNLNLILLHCSVIPEI